MITKNPGKRQLSGIFAYKTKLLSKVSFFGNGLVGVHGDLSGRLFGGDFLSGSLGGDFLSRLFGRCFLGGGLFDGLRLFLAAGALGQGSENLLRPGDDLFTVGSDNVDDAGSGNQSSQNFCNYIECFHGNDLQEIFYTSKV